MSSRLIRWAMALLAAICTSMIAGAAVPSRPTRTIAWLWDGATQPAWSADEVAVVVGHYLLQGDQLKFRPRMHAPLLSAGTRITPVVHVELGLARPPTDLSRHKQVLVDAVVNAGRTSTSGRVQLDMEARPSQREFYLELVKDIRRVLPADTKLSVTALAWWCRSNVWMGDLAADEVVPMYFRMGRDSAELRYTLETSPARLHPRCTSDAAGFSAQEPFDEAVTYRYARAYWFDNRRWHAETSTPHP